MSCQGEAVRRRLRRFMRFAVAGAAAICFAVANSAAPSKKHRPTPEEKFAARVQAILTIDPVAKGEWGILVTDADTGAALYEQNVANYFVPASNMKMFTTAYALSVLGVDYRFHTTLETEGVIDGTGTLSSDLVLVGRGDPNLSNRKFPYNLKEEFEGPGERVLGELADAVAAKGVKEISGDIVGDDSFLPPDRYPSGWEIGDMVWEYGAPISAITVNDNTVTILLTPSARSGDAVTVEVQPPTEDFRVESSVTTSDSGAKPDLTLRREPAGGVVWLMGSLPAGSAAHKLIVSVQDPALHAATLLRRLLEQRGIAVMGRARARHELLQTGQTPTVLAEHVSVPLGDSVKLVNKISQNLHTELLLRVAARQACLTGAPGGGAATECLALTLEKFAEAPEGFYKAAGIADGDVVQLDGSGLSRHDLVTPRGAVALLRYARTQPWFPQYYASFPVAGVDGTLENNLKGTIAAGRIHAKTGSVTHVRTRSGYAETVNGRKLIFSFMANNQGGKNRETSDALDALCLAVLEEFDPAPPKLKK
jgi:serine-type D-Ala-D-Ala carboxypeptidase/endopeptidase (penicillin-binding protein 4)